MKPPYECFLKENNSNRITINYNGFESTECFNKDVLCL